MLNDVAYIDEVKKKDINVERRSKRTELNIIYVLYSIDYSKRRAKANREEEERMQKKYQDAQANFEKYQCVAEPGRYWRNVR